MFKYIQYLNKVFKNTNLKQLIKTNQITATLNMILFKYIFVGSYTEVGLMFKNVDLKNKGETMFVFSTYYFF